MSNYQEPKAFIFKITRNINIITTTLILDKVLDPPLIPSALYSTKHLEEEVLPFHKLIRKKGNTLTFETYKKVLKLPTKNKNYIFRAWWTPDAFELVANRKLSWHLERYPDDGTHVHCPLTYKEISSKSAYREVYRSGENWITKEAYKQFIENDLLRIRSSPNSERK